MHFCEAKSASHVSRLFSYVGSSSAVLETRGAIFWAVIHGSCHQFLEQLDRMQQLDFSIRCGRIGHRKTCDEHGCEYSSGGIICADHSNIIVIWLSRSFSISLKMVCVRTGGRSYDFSLHRGIHTVRLCIHEHSSHSNAIRCYVLPRPHRLILGVDCSGKRSKKCYALKCSEFAGDTMSIRWSIDMSSAWR